MQKTKISIWATFRQHLLPKCCLNSSLCQKMMKNAVLKTINKSFVANIDRYDDMQLHDFLQNLQKKLCDLDERIHRSWFLLHS